MVAEKKPSPKHRTESVAYELLEPSAIPWDRLFEVEERIDWCQINREIAAGRSVRLAELDRHDVEHIEASCRSTALD